MTWVLFWTSVFAADVGLVIDHHDKATNRARADLDRLHKLRGDTDYQSACKLACDALQHAWEDDDAWDAAFAEDIEAWDAALTEDMQVAELDARWHMPAYVDGPPMRRPSTHRRNRGF